ncbi:MAG TPA: SRPBCC family protein [Polyangia bacterium]|nr:SRPBCC family protein [Polyangia bacterium]
MATLRKELRLGSAPERVWDAVRDVGALHTRLVPGFVLDTRMEGDVRVVTFANGLVAREPIVTLDDAGRRLVWSAVGGRTTHYNAAVEVTADGAGTRLVWTIDLLPNEMAGPVGAMQDQAIAAMKRALERAA